MPVPAPVQTLIQEAAFEIGMLGAGESLSATDANYWLSLFNRLLDNWNAERSAVYDENFVQYTLTPNLSPHTIGPTGTFVVTSRPVEVEGAALVLNTSTPNVKTPIVLRDEQWWLAQSVPALTSSVPTDLYYSPDWPNGSLYFWPVPTTAYGVLLQTRTVLSNVLLTDTVNLPPGYRDALTLSLAEAGARPFGRAMPADLPGQAAKARARVWANNSHPPRIQTQDAGIPGSGGGSSPDFNYLTGQVL